MVDVRGYYNVDESRTYSEGAADYVANEQGREDSEDVIGVIAFQLSNFLTTVFNDNLHIDSEHIILLSINFKYFLMVNN